MTTTHRHPEDVELWHDAIRETSTLENLRPHDGLIRQILFGPETLEFTLVGGEGFSVPASADRNVIASAASKALGRSVVVFARIWREGTVAKIEAYDADRTAIAEFDLEADHPPVDTVTDVLDAFTHRS